MDSNRARQIIQSSEFIQVLYDGEPVWLENINDNNTAVVTNKISQRRETVPVYRLVENTPAK